MSYDLGCGRESVVLPVTEHEGGRLIAVASGIQWIDVAIDNRTDPKPITIGGQSV